jgi:hypothetical protein
MNNQDRHELIQRYVDQTISDEELNLFQDMLKNDASLREAFLLYVRMDVAIRDYVLFHNYMDDDFRENIVFEGENVEETEIARITTSQQKTFYQKIFLSLFPQKKLH